MTQTTNHPAPEKENERLSYALGVITYLPEGGWYSVQHTHKWNKRKKKWVKI